MAVHHDDRGSTFDPTFSFVSERIRSHQHEAHANRLAARSVVIGSTSMRERLGNALIALGSSLAAPAASRRPSLTD